MFKLITGDALTELSKLPNQSIDAIISDPPYAEIDRDYGRMSEKQWHELMQGVVKESQRIIKPTGSAMFILQPNSEHIGKMRLWMWEFLLWAAKEWNLVQDVYWWNTCALPHSGVNRGLMRASIKMCIWLGSPDCYRNQDGILLDESDGMKRIRQSGRVRPGRKYRQSGHSVNDAAFAAAVERRGGVTPFNCLPIGNSKFDGHPAATPLSLCQWWATYICPVGGTILDMFSGCGTVGLAALQQDKNYIGIESSTEYQELATKRLG